VTDQARGEVSLAAMRANETGRIPLHPDGKQLDRTWFEAKLCLGQSRFVNVTNVDDILHQHSTLVFNYSHSRRI
jgi:hypothetical protein